MKCCQSLTDGTSGRLPFERAIVTGYYDGPTEGFTQCPLCGRAYAFKKLDWDESQDVRIFAFALIDITFDKICDRLGLNFGDRKTLIIVPPLAESENKFVQMLFSIPPIRVTAFEGWPGKSSVWRDITGINVGAVTDWFSFLGISKRQV